MSVMKVVFVIFFITQGPAIQVAVPKGKKLNANFYKTKVLPRWKKIHRPAIGLSNVRLLHDNVSSHKGSIVQDFLKQKKVVVFPRPPYLPDHLPCDFFLFRKLKNTFLVKKIEQCKHLSSAIFQCLDALKIL